MLLTIPRCVLYIIMRYLDLKTQINFKKTCKKFSDLFIFNLTGKTLLNKLNTKVLKQKCFNNLYSLHFYNCLKPQIKLNLTSFNKLTVLKIGSNINISMTNLKQLNLVELNLFSNKHIFEIRSLTTLKKLNIAYTLINESELSNLNLIKLDISGTDIKNIGHMTNLRSLNLSYDLSTDVNPGVTNCDLKNINPKKLNIRNNTLISDISHMTHLKTLNCAGNSILNSDNLIDINLKKIYCNGNPFIHNLQHMTRLKYIICSSIQKKTIIY